MKIIVNPHKLEIEKSPVNEKEINITKCEFVFADEITNDYVKEAYFTYKDNTYKQIIVNNECDIPSEVLQEKGQVTIGVVAFLVENEAEIKRYNPSPAYFESWLGSLKDAENSEPITPSEMEQYEQALQDGLSEVNDKLDEIDQALEDVNTAIEETNNLDLDVSKSGKTATVTLTKKDASTKVVTLSDGTSLMFNWDGTKLGIKTDEDAEYTYVDLQGIQGPIGPKGEAFTIKKTYSSVAEMNDDFNNMQLGDYVMIASTTEIEDNAKLYTRGETQWIFISDFSGAQGIRGETGLTPDIQIGTVVSGNAPAVTRSGTNEQPILNFVLEKGAKGDTGEKGDTGNTGNGIASIVKTSTSGLVDTYTITFTDGTTTTYEVTNGEDGEVTQEQLDAVIAENEYLNSIIDQLPKVIGEGEYITLNNTIEGKMSLELGSTELEQGADPSPSNPQQIHTISGDNEIVVSNKNLFDIDTCVLGKVWNGTSNNKRAYGYIEATQGQSYTISNNNTNSDLKIYVVETTTIGQAINPIKQTQLTNSNYTFTPQSTTRYIVIQFSTTANNTTQEDIDNAYIMIEQGSTATSYIEHKEQVKHINLGTLEYCEIGDYKDEFYMPSGKNLFDGLFRQGNRYTDGFNETTRIFTTQNLLIKAGQPYTISTTLNTSIYKYAINLSTIEFPLPPNTQYFYDSGWKTTSTFTFTPNQDGYLGIIIAKSNGSDNLTPNDISSYTFMLNEGSTALPYEPYNNGKWYLKKNIGKVVLDGSETYTQSYASQSNAKHLFKTIINDLKSAINDTEILGIYSNNYNNGFSYNTLLYANEGTMGICVAQNHTLTISDGNYVFSTQLNDFKSWLSTHNTIVYYILATPTYTLLNDTLQDQINDIYYTMKSYKEQTNISQVNNDLGFTIKASALLDLNSLIG